MAGCSLITGNGPETWCTPGFREEEAPRGGEMLEGMLLQPLLLCVGVGLCDVFVVVLSKWRRLSLSLLSSLWKLVACIVALMGSLSAFVACLLGVGFSAV